MVMGDFRQDSGEPMYTDIDIKTALALKNKCFIDVRSPAEYAEGTIPGAVNVPLFDDNERRLIGITYRQKGVKQAKLDGLKVVAPKLPALVAGILERCQGKKPVIFAGGEECAAGLWQCIGIGRQRPFALKGAIRPIADSFWLSWLPISLLPSLWYSMV